MNETEIKDYLKNKLNFSNSDIIILSKFKDELLLFNKRYNLISKTTESTVWHRHILDSAQLVKFIDFNLHNSLSDLGTGGGFPGLVLAVYNKNPKFHVKLYEKSKIKCKFLNDIKKKLNLNYTVYENDYHYHKINSFYIVCRAFKKLPKILDISREIVSKPHQLIILKGKDTQEKIKSAFKDHNHKYRLVKSITNKESNIVIAQNDNNDA